MTLANLICNMDIKDNLSFALKPSTNYINVVLGSGTAKNFTRAQFADPDGKLPNIMVFNSTAKFYVKWRGTDAAIPVSDVLDGSGVELDPTIRKIDDVTNFSLIAPANAIVTIGFYFR